jgi:hypothetical protein
MSFERREYAGAAPATNLAAGIDSDDLAVALDSGSGYPTGAIGPFVIVIGRGLSNEEKILCSSRSSGTITVEQRGYDDTSAAAHATGESVEHCATAVDFDEANEHITNTALDHHTQYLNTTRHAAVSHDASMLASDSVTTSKIVDGNVTGVKLAANSVGTAKISTAAVTTAKIADDAVTADQLATDSVTSDAIAADAVGTAEIAADAVTSSEIATDAVGSAEIVAGAVGTAELADAGVTAAKIAAEAYTSYTVTIAGWTKGNGTVTGKYLQTGKRVDWEVSFVLGTTSQVDQVGTFSLPVTAARTGGSGTTAYFDTSGNAWFNGTYVITTTGLARLMNCDSTLSKNTGAANSPFTWATGDEVHLTGHYEAA